MDTGKKYQNSDGEDCSIWQMIREEPDWIASRFQFMENKIEELEGKLKKKQDCQKKCSLVKVNKQMHLRLNTLTEALKAIRETLGDFQVPWSDREKKVDEIARVARNLPDIEVKGEG